MSNRTLIATLTVAAAVAAPDAANAMTTSVERDGGGVRIRVLNESALDDKNSIGVSEDAAENLVVTDISDQTDAVVPSGSCFQVSPNTVACPDDPSNTSALVVTTGQGNDSVTIDLPTRPSSGISSVFVNGGNGADTIVGSQGPDTLEGDGLLGSGGVVPATMVSPGKDVIFGRGDRDTLRGGDAADYLNGAGGATGPDGANVLEGGPGSDFFDLGQALGADRVDGGTQDFSPQLIAVPGISDPVFAPGDTVSYERRTFSTAGTAGVTVDLDGVADDGGTGAGEGDQIGSDVETLVGSPRDDRLIGSSAVNRLDGGPGVDTLSSGGGADTLLFRDGVRDRCYSLSGGVTVSLDLVDPVLSDCQITIFPVDSTIRRLPTDETMSPPVIGSALRRSRGKGLIATMRCDRAAPKSCAGRLTAEPPRGGKRLARGSYRVPPGASRRVLLAGRAAALRSLRSARLTAVGRGVSRRGSTEVVVQRRVR